jgi:flavin-dependent dehydrogenase
MPTVAIVGAGPAGASAGYHLASRGHSVTLLDRAAFPRPKVCGDWIAEGSVEALAASGLLPDELERAASEHAVISGSRVASPRGETSEVRHSRRAFCIPRLVFDDILLRRALRAGCAFERDDVRDVRPGHRGRLDAFDHVIDARGVYAGRANCVALRAYWTVDMEGLDPSWARTVHFFADGVFRRGYGWVFPVAQEGERVRFNLGVGLWKADSRGPGRSVAAFWERFLGGNPMVRALEPRVVESTRAQGHHVAVAEWRNRVSGDGVLRIGDAANLTDPLTGEGIANALRSGALAAEAIHRAAGAAEAERTWQSLYEREFAPDLRVALVVRTLLVGTRAKDAALWLMKRRPAFAERFHASLAGAHPWRRLLSARALL